MLEDGIVRMKPVCRTVWAAIIGLSIFVGWGASLRADGAVRRDWNVERTEDKKRMERLIRSSDRLRAADREMNEAYESAAQTEQLNTGFLESEQIDWLLGRNAGVICEEGSKEIACLERFILARADQISGLRDAAIAVGGEYIEMVQSLVDGCWDKAERAKPGGGIRWFMRVEMDCLMEIVVRIRKLYGSTVIFEGREYRPFGEAAYRESLTNFMRRYFELAESAMVCHACGSIWIEIISSHSRQFLQSLVAIASTSHRSIPKHVYFKPMGYETWKLKP